MPEQNDERNPVGSGWRPWQIYMALISLFMTLSTVVYNVAVSKTTQDSRTTQLEKDVEEIRQDYERRDVVEQRLTNIEATERRIEEANRQQGDTLQKILIEARHR